MMTEQSKADWWKGFSATFLSELESVDPKRLYPAFASPTKGSSGEAVINAMRTAFDSTFDSVFETVQGQAFSIDGDQQEPSDAWDPDFKEPR